MVFLVFLIVALSCIWLKLGSCIHFENFKTQKLIPIAALFEFYKKNIHCYFPYIKYGNKLVLTPKNKNIFDRTLCHINNLTLKS
jgi:hypothetical protein